MAANLQVLFDNRPTAKVSPSNFRIVETPVPTPGPGQVLVRTSVSVARSLYARPAQRRQILRDAAGARRGDAEAARSAIVEASDNPKFKVGDAVVGMGGWQRYALSDGRGLQRRRRQSDPDPGLSRPGRHAGRHRLVRPQQDHRAEGRRDGAGLGGDRRGRLGGRPARQARAARGRSGSPAARRNAPMRWTSSATPPASITSRRISPRR